MAVDDPYRKMLSQMEKAFGEPSQGTIQPHWTMLRELSLMKEQDLARQYEQRLRAINNNKFGCLHGAAGEQYKQVREKELHVAQGQKEVTKKEEVSLDKKLFEVEMLHLDQDN